MPEINAGKLADQIEAQDVPQEVSAWLGRLVVLYGVPFQYLVPEQEMLPVESIRFFYLDPIWIQCLVQGACSVGNTDAGDTLIDRAMNSQVQPNQPANQKPSATAKAAAGVRDLLREEYEGIAVPTQSQNLAWPLTGFLLRSSVVTGWRGLEIMAYRRLVDEADKAYWAAQKLNDDDAKELAKGFAPLQALRIEQLSPDVMVGIFNGGIAELVIRQPQESLHFGLTRDDKTIIKTLRNLGFKVPADAGNPLKEVIDLGAKGLLRVQPQTGVINITDLAKEMKKILADQLLKEKFTSAEFAVEMIEAAGQFTFSPAKPMA
jgi:hypothetical protein